MGKGRGSIADFYVEAQEDGYGFDSDGEWDHQRAYDEKIDALCDRGDGQRRKHTYF